MSDQKNDLMKPWAGDYASLWRRLGAELIDAVLVSIPGLLLGSVSYGVAFVLAWIVYSPVFESSALKATIGKHLMGIQVTHLRGDRISFPVALIRNLVKWASTFFLFIPWLLALFTERKQALHDMISETVVIYGRADLPVFDTYMEHVRELIRGTPLVQGDGSKLSALERLQILYEKGALSREEFEREKKKIIGE